MKLILRAIINILIWICFGVVGLFMALTVLFLGFSEVLERWHKNLIKN